MSLLKTIDDVKRYCSIIDVNMSMDSLTSYMRKAEKYVKECLGTVTYNALVTAVDATELTGAQKALLPYVLDPLTNITLYFWVNAGQIQVSDKGVQVDHSGTSKTAFQWQIDAWMGDLEAAGFDGLDELLAFLETNKATYTDWAADTLAFTLNKVFYTDSAVTFSNIVDIGNSRRVFKRLYPYIYMAHDMELKPNLGEDFYNELKVALTAGTLSANQKLLVPMLQKCEVYFAMAKAYGPLRFKITGSGLRSFETLSSIENADTQKAVSSLDAEANAQAMENYGKFYLKALIKYLNKNADNYSIWKNGDLYVDPDAEAGERNYLGDGIVGIF